MIYSVAWLVGFGQVPDSLNTTPSGDFLQESSPPVYIPTDTAVLKTDSAKAKKRGFLYRVWRKDYPKPKNALLLSLAIPGAGQLYNKRWWKLPFVYGGLGVFIISIRNNNRQYKLFRDAFIAELAGEPHPFSNLPLDANDLKRFRDKADKNRQLAIIGLMAVYMLQGAEAFVDSHLRSFEVNEDLSFKIKPSLQQTPFQDTAIGFGLSFRFEKKRERFKDWGIEGL